MPNEVFRPAPSVVSTLTTNPSPLRGVVSSPVGPKDRPPPPPPPPPDGHNIDVAVRPISGGTYVVCKGPHGLTAQTNITISENSVALINGDELVNPVGYPPHVFRCFNAKGSSQLGIGGRWELAPPADEPAADVAQADEPEEPEGAKKKPFPQTSEAAEAEMSEWDL